MTDSATLLSTTAIDGATAYIARPKPLTWTPHRGGWAADSPLGLFSVLPLPAAMGGGTGSGLWLPLLHDAPFPVLAQDAQAARDLATLGQIAHQDHVLDLHWTPAAQGAQQAEGRDSRGQPVLWTVRPSHGGAGYVALRQDQAAYVPLGDRDQALGACQQYASYVWLHLTEILGTAR